MIHKGRRKSKWISPFIVLGVFVILVPIFVFLAFESVSEHKKRVREKLTGKGIFLIRAIEAGTRTGILGMQWGADRVGRLLTETSFQPGVRYIVITDEAGRVLAHSNPEADAEFHENMPAAGDIESTGEKFYTRVVLDAANREIYEVYKTFTPEKRPALGRRYHQRPGAGDMPHQRGERFRHFKGLMHGDSLGSPSPETMDWCRQRFAIDRPASEKPPLLIFAGIDMAPAKRIQEGFLLRTAVLVTVLFLIGLAGVVSLFALQAYRSAKSSLTRVMAFSDNVVQNMPAGLVTVNRDMGILSFNKTALEIFGNEEPLGLPVQMLEMAEKSRLDSRTVSEEKMCELSGGEKVRLDVSVSPIFGDLRDIEGFMFLFKDLTELAELKEEIEKNRRLAAVGKLAAGIAHEIRNPLSSIKGLATYFMERFEDANEDRHTARIMAKETERLNRSVTQLLEFAKPLEVVLKEVEVQSLFDHALSLVTYDLEKTGITPKIHIESTSKTVILDPERLDQILLNLFLNSIQAMPDGGTLDLSVSDLSDGTGIVITVADTGIGIDPEDIDHIFDPYFTARPQGTGLGLAMVQKAVEALRGEIRVTSRKGEGTYFTIKLRHRELDENEK